MSILISETSDFPSPFRNGAWIVRLGFIAICMLQSPNFLAPTLWAQDTSLPPLMKEFTGQGMSVVPSVQEVMPQPLLTDTDTPEVRTTRLEQLAARHGWQRFSRPSPVAPVHIDVAYIHDPSGTRVGHRIYSAFIAYAPLEKLKDQKLLESLLASGEDENAEPIGFAPEPVPDSILALVGIENSDDPRVRYSTVNLPLMNRVTLRGTARIEKLETEHSVLVVWQLDPRFTFPPNQPIDENLAAYANHSVKTQRDDLGRTVESDPIPYSGCGGYLSVHQTGLEENQLLIESRMILHEPNDWFAGSNFLRSKLPTALQENAQSFRRKIK